MRGHKQTRCGFAVQINDRPTKTSSLSGCKAKSTYRKGLRFGVRDGPSSTTNSLDGGCTISIVVGTVGGIGVG